MHVEPGAFCDAVTPELAASIMIALRPPGPVVAATGSCESFMELHIADAHLRRLAEASLAEQDPSDLENVTIRGRSAVVTYRAHTFTLPADTTPGAIPTVVPASAYPYRIALARGTDGRWRLAPDPQGLGS